MKKVLVIDDDVLLVRLIEYNLSQVGVEVIKAYTGYEGISLARTRHLVKHQFRESDDDIKWSAQFV
ncbi:unnamed protein product [marine sediment metagenome]|uniref:Response regulatory domain-containing protein n=1 Tax=marine sediment metagenome TaxID=412755 RepID=X1RLY1_9ZZZZ